MFGLPIRPLIVVGVAVAAAMASRGGHLWDGAGALAGVLPCRYRVAADTLNVRSGPGTVWPVVDTYHRNAVTGAERTLRSGFRRLTDGRWVADRYLVPVFGFGC